MIHHRLAIYVRKLNKTCLACLPSSRLHFLISQNFEFRLEIHSLISNPLVVHAIIMTSDSHLVTVFLSLPALVKQLLLAMKLDNVVLRVYVSQW